MFDHSIPIFVLLADFVFNVVPFCWRHFFVIILYFLVYLVVNILGTLSRGKPIYAPLNWFSTQSFIFAGGITVGVILIFAIVKFIQDIKLVHNGYSAIIGTMKDPNHLRKHTNIEQIAQQKDVFGLYNHYKPSRFNSVQI